MVPVPDSGTPAAIGFSQAAGIPFELGIIRNHYVGRTFIQPGDSIRHMGVKLKHNANRRIIEGKRVVLVDDSIVRGTTSQKIVQMVRDAGANGSASCASPRRRRAPPASTASTRRRSRSCWPRACRWRRWPSSSASILLGFLSIDGLYRAVGEPGRDNEQPQFCDACFTERISDPAARLRRPRQCAHAVAAGDRRAVGGKRRPTCTAVT